MVATDSLGLPVAIEELSASCDLVAMVSMLCTLVDAGLASLEVIETTTVGLADDPVFTVSKVDTLSLGMDVAAARVVDEA